MRVAGFTGAEYRFMDLLLIAFLTILNGLFAMSEMALASSRKALLTAQAEEGVAGAQAALDLQLRPTEFLSTIQIGITTLGVLNGIIGEEEKKKTIDKLNQVLDDSAWGKVKMIY